jgi:hypothetical protein
MSNGTVESTSKTNLAEVSLSKGATFFKHTIDCVKTTVGNLKNSNIGKKLFGRKASYDDGVKAFGNVNAGAGTQNTKVKISQSSSFLPKQKTESSNSMDSLLGMYEQLQKFQDGVRRTLNSSFGDEDQLLKFESKFGEKINQVVNQIDIERTYGEKIDSFMKMVESEVVDDKSIKDLGKEVKDLEGKHIGREGLEKLYQSLEDLMYQACDAMPTERLLGTEVIVLRGMKDQYLTS